MKFYLQGLSLLTMTFFWQTTQPPTGPGGTDGLASAEQTGTAAGPIPAPVATPVPETSNAWPLIIIGLLALAGSYTLGLKGDAYL